MIPPFALLYLYLVFAAAFGLPSFSTQRLFDSEVLAWLGVLCRIGGMTLMLWSLVSFGSSFRVGIDVEHPDRLVTTGVFAYSRNPIYVAFASVLIGEFLIFPSWILLVCLVAGIWMFNRQILREEVYLASHYGQEYADYRARVRRYL